MVELDITIVHLILLSMMMVGTGTIQAGAGGGQSIAGNSLPRALDWGPLVGAISGALHAT